MAMIGIVHVMILAAVIITTFISVNGLQPMLDLKITLPSYCNRQLSPEELMVLANSTALKDDQDTVEFGPHLRLGIVTYASKNIWDYAAYAMAINAAYAEHRGYSLTILDETSANFERGDSRWNKVKLLEASLDPFDGFAQDLDYIVWIDADFVFLDFSFRLESVVTEALNTNAHIYASAEHAGSSTLINSGCMIIRNTLWARQFLSEWWEYSDRSLFSDQEQFDLLYENRRRAAHSSGDERTFTDKIVILAPDRINSDPPAMIQQKDYNQVLHLMGEETHYRVKVFSTGLAELCRHHNTLHTTIATNTHNTLHALAPQLTLTQPNLLYWAVQQYSNTSKQLLIEYENTLPPVHTLSPTYTSATSSTPNTASTSNIGYTIPQGLHTSRVLANTVHHFAHAHYYYAEQGGVGGTSASSSVGTSDGGSSCSTSSVDSVNNTDINNALKRRREGLIMRKKVYQLLRRNLVAWKKLKLYAPPPLTSTNSVGVGGSDSIGGGSSDGGVGSGGTSVSSSSSSSSSSSTTSSNTGTSKAGGNAFELIRADWPELLKITAIAGQHLLSIDVSIVSIREKRHISGEILSMMEEMVIESHSAQHSAILLMVADIHSQIGLLDLSESYTAMNSVGSVVGGSVGSSGSEGGGGSSGSIGVTGSDTTTNTIDNNALAQRFTQAALQHFQLSLDVTQRIAEKSGKHLLVSPLTLTANALASLRRFSGAIELYEQAIQLNAAHYGSTHSSNAALLVDFGISLVLAATSVENTHGTHTTDTTTHNTNTHTIHNSVSIDGDTTHTSQYTLHTHTQHIKYCTRAIQVLNTANSILRNCIYTPERESVLCSRIIEYLALAKSPCSDV